MSKPLGTPGEFWSNGRRTNRKSNGIQSQAAGRNTNGHEHSEGTLSTTTEMPLDEGDWRRELWELLLAALGKLSALEEKVSQVAVPNGSQPKCYTTEEAGREMKVEGKTVEKYCREGLLKGFKANGRGKNGEWRLSAEEMERWKQHGLRRPKIQFPDFNDE